MSTMPTDYIAVALRFASCETLPDGSVYCEIPQLPGVWSNADNAPAALVELREVLEGWIELCEAQGQPLPAIINSADLDVLRRQR
jgi:predicted RNase H-like HicB family nuclease